MADLVPLVGRYRTLVIEAARSRFRKYRRNPDSILLDLGLEGLVPRSRQRRMRGVVAGLLVMIDAVAAKFPGLIFDLTVIKSKILFVQATKAAVVR